MERRAERVALAHAPNGANGPNGPSPADEHAERRERVPLYRTIADTVIRDIRRGRYAEGARLPASRALAKRLEVNRATVHQALQVLKREGWIETNKGGGTRITLRSTAGPVVGAEPSWDRISSSLLARVVSEPYALEAAGKPPDGSIDLSRLSPDEKEFPAERFAELLGEAARNGSLLSYGSPFGYRPLRETLAERLRKRGIPADPDALLVVNGAQQGLDLVTRALVDPGDPVAAEEPSYAGALSLFRAHRARLLPIPLDAEGPEVSAAARALGASPKFLYAIPDFQNPTGLLTSAARRAEIASLAGAAGVLLVEDAFDADLSVEGELPAPFAALAPERVIHLGTISKALFPGVRIGWVSGPRAFIHRLAALKRVGELTSPPVLQAAVNLFIVRGEYEHHLTRIRARLKGRLALAHRVVVSRFPVGSRCERPSGGFILWIELPDGVSGRALAAAAREKGILVSPGADYVAESRDVSAIRISVSRGTGPEIERALTALGAIARTLTRQASRREKARALAPASEEALIQT